MVGDDINGSYINYIYHFMIVTFVIHSKKYVFSGFWFIKHMIYISGSSIKRGY